MPGDKNCHSNNGEKKIRHVFQDEQAGQGPKQARTIENNTAVDNELDDAY
jgi:hypothetical protein